MKLDQRAVVAGERGQRVGKSGILRNLGAVAGGLVAQRHAALPRRAPQAGGTVDGYADEPCATVFFGLKIGIFAREGQEDILADVFRVGVAACAGIGQPIDQRSVELDHPPDVHAVAELHGILSFQT